MEDKQKSTLENLSDKIVLIVQSLQELTGRIDERVKFLLDHQNSMEDTLKNVVAQQSHIMERVILLESKNLDKIIAEISRAQELNQNALNKLVSLDDKINKIESTNASTAARITSGLDLVVKTLVVTILGWVLFKLGFNPALIGH